MNFEIGDEVIYNPSVPDLPPANQRPRDWGRIVNISNGYLHIHFDVSNYRDRIRPAAITYSPKSPKYFRNAYGAIVASIPEANINFKIQNYKKTYQKALYDLIHVVFSKEVERDSFEFATWNQLSLMHTPTVC